MAIKQQLNGVSLHAVKQAISGNLFVIIQQLTPKRSTKLTNLLPSKGTFKLTWSAYIQSQSEPHRAETDVQKFLIAAAGWRFNCKITKYNQSLLLQGDTSRTSCTHGCSLTICIYKLDGNYLPTFASLSRTTDTGSLPPGDLCKHLVVAQRLSGHLAKNSVQSLVFPSCCALLIIVWLSHKTNAK